MESGQQELGTNGKGKGARGRIEAGQESVIKLESLQTKMKKLVELHNHAEAVAQDFKDAVKAAAEASGLLAATVSKYVRAKAGENFEETKAKVTQLSLVFEELN